LHQLVKAFTAEEFYMSYVKLPSEHTPLAMEIEDNPKLFPYFKDCLGALDGTHVNAFVEDLVRARYRNRKGDVTQNVLAACTFDMRFAYAITGWEGSVSDSRMYEEARMTTFTIPPNKYYLGDAGFPLCDHLLVPYHGVQYHLKEWSCTNNRYHVFVYSTHLNVFSMFQTQQLQGIIQPLTCPSLQCGRTDFWCPEKALQGYHLSSPISSPFPGNARSSINHSPQFHLHP
jgi:hypothetical protein